MATWLLVVADTLSYAQKPKPYGPNASLDVALETISALQISGASLLALGSVLYTYWAYSPTGKEDPV